MHLRHIRIATDGTAEASIVVREGVSETAHEHVRTGQILTLNMQPYRVTALVPNHEEARLFGWLALEPLIKDDEVDRN